MNSIPKKPYIIWLFCVEALPMQIATDSYPHLFVEALPMQILNRQYMAYVVFCKYMQSDTKNCQNCKQDFIIEPEDFSFYEKIKVPPPTFCPLCRAQRRFAYRNERKLFKVKDYFNGKTLFSLHPEESGKRIVSQEEWFKDNWDAMDYGRDYGFTRTFFEQFKELQLEVPAYNLNVEFMVNSPYCANASYVKNSYLCFNTNHSEDCMYGNATDFSKDCIDNSHINHSERCYECFWLQNCYQCYFTIMSVESRNLWFCRDCLGCSDCFGCTNLRKSSYCIFNKQYTKEEYFDEIKKLKLNTISGILNVKEIARNFWKSQPTKCSQGLKNLNSTGSYVTNSKNVNDSFLVREGENLKYCQYLQVPTNKDCYDASSWGDNMELDYETCLCGGNSYFMKFSSNCWPNCKNCEYCIDIFSCSDCFGCVGLKKKQYCILNKQYSKEEYFELVEKIKRHMDEMPYADKKGNIYKYGEFFPIELSLFGYNNSTSIQYFPMTREKAQEYGYPWIEVPRGNYTITKRAHELLDAINDATLDILKDVIECSGCKKAYKILEQELDFYKKENIPLPTLCNECRFERRIEDRLKFNLYNRKCMCKGDSTNGTYINTRNHSHGNGPCDEVFKTGYNPDSSQIVYCEKCYQQEVS